MSYQCQPEWVEIQKLVSRIVCDGGCGQDPEIGKGVSALRQREILIIEGWLCDDTGDWCPKHAALDARERSEG